MKSDIRCIIVDDEKVARDILEQHLRKIDRVELVAGCRNVAEAWNVIQKEKIDLIFLDINMPEVSGLSFARTLAGDCKVIFTTAYREFALDGFDLQAVDYLLKPISFERLMQSLQKYLKEQPSVRENAGKEVDTEGADFLFVRSNRKMMRINFREILYLESMSDYVNIYMENQKVVTRETLNHFESLLPEDKFLRIHRSYIVAVDRITAYTKEDVEVSSRELPISRNYRSLVSERLK